MELNHIKIIGSVFTYSLYFPGGVELPNAQSVRFIIAFWWMLCLVLVATYSGNLIAFLTVYKAPEPFTTVNEMASQKHYAVSTVAGTALASTLRVSSLSNCLFVDILSPHSILSWHIDTNIHTHHTHIYIIINQTRNPSYVH